MPLKAFAQSFTRQTQLVTHEVLLACRSVVLVLLAIFLDAVRDRGTDGER